MAAPTSRNPFHQQLTPDNASMLLVDHQAGLFLGVGDMDP